MGGTPTTPLVLGVLNTKFLGKVATIDQLVEATGLDEKQVRTTMNRLTHNSDLDLTVVTRGQMWKWNGSLTAQKTNSEPEAVDTIFEVVGTASKGETIVRGDTTNRLFKVVAI